MFQLTVKSNQNHLASDAVSDYISCPSRLQVTAKFDVHICSVLLLLFDNDVGSVETEREALIVTTHFHVDPELFIKLMVISHKLKMQSKILIPYFSILSTKLL